MIKKELVRRFGNLCEARPNCSSCPSNQSKVCDGVSTEEDLTDEDYEKAIQLLETNKETEEIFAGFDVVERPAHYTKTSIECIDAMRETQGDEAVKAFCVCNAFKYLWRHNRKNGDEDIKKANWYLNKAVEIMEGEKDDN